MQLIAEYSDSKTQNITRSDARVAYARRKKVTRLLPQCLSILWTSLNWTKFKREARNADRNFTRDSA